MKIALNLAVSPSWRERYALAWSLPTMLVALLVMLGFIHSMLADFRAYRKLEGDLAAPQRQEAELARREAEHARLEAMEKALALSAVPGKATDVEKMYIAAIKARRFPAPGIRAPLWCRGTIRAGSQLAAPP